MKCSAIAPNIIFSYISKFPPDYVEIGIHYRRYVIQN